MADDIDLLYEQSKNRQLQALRYQNRYWPAIFNRRRGANDSTPDQFTFVDQTDVDLSTVITSAAVVLTGFSDRVAITVTGGEYNINGGAYTSSAGTVIQGDTITAQHTSSGSPATAVDTVVTVGGVSDTFTSTTA